jgi:RimJ/RimL family protein N-acetyltransferase
MTSILSTQRLTLKPFSHEDAAFVQALVNSPGWLQFIGDRNVHNEEQAIAYLDNNLMKSYSEHGFGFWKVELTASSNAVGMCGITKRAHLPYPDLGYAFLPSYFGKGYALEIARATLMYSTEVLKIPKLLAITNQDNDASIKLLKKLDFILDGTTFWPGDSKELNLFSYSKG